MYCIKCGKEIKDGTKFCAYCGASQEDSRETVQPVIVPETNVDPDATVRLEPAFAPNNPPTDKKEPEKSPKGLLIAIVIIIIALILLAGGTVTWLLLSNRDSNSSEDQKVEEKSDNTSTDDTESETEGETTSRKIFDDEPESDTVTEPATETTADTETVTTPATETVTTPAATTTPAPVPTGDYLESLILSSDSVLFDEALLSTLTATECKRLRNGIYARHGRMFNDNELQNYFLQFSWYDPSIHPDDFNEVVFNKTEKANVDLIKNYETAHGYR